MVFICIRLSEMPTVKRKRCFSACTPSADDGRMEAFQGERVASNAANKLVVALEPPSSHDFENGDDNAASCEAAQKQWTLTHAVRGLLRSSYLSLGCRLAALASPSIRFMRAGRARITRLYYTNGKCKKKKETGNQALQRCALAWLVVKLHANCVGAEKIHSELSRELSRQR